MVRLIFIFALALFITLFTMWKVEATPSVPEVGQLIRPPYVIQYQQAKHYVFFTKIFPIAFKTDHNPLWNDLVKKSCRTEGCK